MSENGVAMRPGDWSLQQTRLSPFDLACRALGVLSIASGLALASTPKQAADFYGLPQQPPLLRVLGARDVAIGALLLSPRTASGGCTLRSSADAFDLGLIMAESSRRSRPALATCLRMAGAVSLIATASWLRAHLAPRSMPQRTRPLRRR